MKSKLLALMLVLLGTATYLGYPSSEDSVAFAETDAAKKTVGARDVAAETKDIVVTAKDYRVDRPVVDVVKTLTDFAYVVKTQAENLKSGTPDQLGAFYTTYPQYTNAAAYKKYAFVGPASHPKYLQQFQRGNVFLVHRSGGDYEKTYLAATGTEIMLMKSDLGSGQDSPERDENRAFIRNRIGRRASAICTEIIGPSHAYRAVAEATGFWNMAQQPPEVSVHKYARESDMLDAPNYMKVKLRLPNWNPSPEGLQQTIPWAAASACGIANRKEVCIQRAYIFKEIECEKD